MIDLKFFTQAVNQPDGGQTHIPGLLPPVGKLSGIGSGVNTVMFKDEVLRKAVVYQVKVRGCLDPRWSIWFDGFRIENKEEITILTGPVPDQAGLHGLLAKIRDLGLELIFLRILEEGDLSSGKK